MNGPSSGVSDKSQSSVAEHAMLAIVTGVADHLLSAADASMDPEGRASRAAAELGRLDERADGGVGHMLDRFHILEDVLTQAVESEARRLSPPLDVWDVERLMARARDAVRALQRQAVEILVTAAEQSIAQQSAQLQRFRHLVSHEVRRPLSVLRVVARTLTVADGDVEAIRVIEILDRSVARLAEMTGRVERDSAMAATDTLPGERAVALSAIAASVARQLDRLAAVYGVQLRIDESLPVVRLDHWQAELVFLNLIANGIKHSDPAKPLRIVEVSGLGGSDAPAVVIRDGDQRRVDLAWSQACSLIPHSFILFSSVL